MLKLINKVSDFIFSDPFEMVMAGICFGLLWVEILYQIADRLSK